MKTHKPLLVLATAALTGCVNIGSFNTKDPGQKPPGAARTPVASTQPTPAPKAAATPVVKKVAPKPTAATPAPTPAPAVASKPSSAPAATPKPTPSSQVIKEETTSKVEVISSRPVVGTDAQMGN
jgi:hypothetical protein